MSDIKIDIKKGDFVLYTMQDESTFEAIVEGRSVYQKQERVNLKILATGELKNGMSLSRCTKIDQPTETVDQIVEVKEVEYTGECFAFNGLELPIRKTNSLTKHLIPAKREYFIEEKRQEDFEDIYDSVNEHENILLVGEPGCGKSEFVLWLAAELSIPVVQVQGDGEMSVVDMVGGFQFNEDKKGTYWVDGIIPTALRQRCWILFDEINMTLPEVLSRLHSMMDDRRHLDLKEIGEILKRTDDTVIFGTMNPSEDGRHVGTKPLSPALWSRFNLIVNFDFLDPKNEIKLITGRTGVSEEDAKQMLTFATEARKGFRNNEVSEVVDTRMLLAWGKKTKKFGIRRGLKNTILSRLDSDSINVLRGVLIAYGIEEAEGRN